MTNKELQPIPLLVFDNHTGKTYFIKVPNESFDDDLDLYLSDLLDSPGDLTYIQVNDGFDVSQIISL